MTNNQFIEPLLNALWLRPESALWYSYMLEAARDFGAHELARPNLDFGCMDGLNSYLLLGGKPPFSFDVFDSVTTDGDMYRKTTLEDDYYDVPPASLEMAFPVIEHPFDFGCDWKQSHVDRARQFNSHRQLQLIPRTGLMHQVATDSLMGIWAPNLYWMKNVEQVLAEFSRIVSREGKIVTILPDRSVLSTLVLRHTPRLRHQWLAQLDRGRYENASRSARSFDEWTRSFESSGLIVRRASRFLPRPVNHVYEIGFRPMFGPLLAMRNGLVASSREDFLDVKHAWVMRVRELLDLAWGGDPEVESDDSKLWHIFELAPCV